MHFWIEFIGWIASILIVGAYFLNIRGIVQAKSPWYIWANLIGGAFFVVHTIAHKAYPSAAVNVIWVLIAAASLLAAKRAAISGRKTVAKTMVKE